MYLSQLNQCHPVHQVHYMRIVYCKPDEDNTSIWKEKYTMKMIKTKFQENAK
jgi:hypothetical protein